MLGNEIMKGIPLLIKWVMAIGRRTGLLEKKRSIPQSEQSFKIVCIGIKFTNNY